MNNHIRAYREYAEGIKTGGVIGLPTHEADVILELLDYIEQVEVQRDTVATAMRQIQSDLTMLSTAHDARTGALDELWVNHIALILLNRATRALEALDAPEGEKP